MDLYCPKCAEPWDNDAIHEQAKEERSNYQLVAAQFRMIGCEALGTSHGEGVAHPGIAIVYELSGDDMDGAASDLDDFMAMGMFDDES
jgi:hypothetical protein